MQRRGRRLRSSMAVILGGSLVALPCRLLAQDEGGPPPPPPDQGYQQGPGPGDGSSDVQVPNQGVPEGWEDQLSPYGNWVNVPDYGWCWQPNSSVVGSDFRPYLTGGSWDYTPDGWVFDTPWSWGSLTYHYGRWFNAPGQGWLWVPGTQWAPSWVDWRVGDGYIGWAPLAPRGYHWRGGAYDQWAFVHGNGFVGRGLQDRVVPTNNVATIYASTRPSQTTRTVNGARVNAGPSRQVVEKSGAHVAVTKSIRPSAPVAAQRVPIKHPSNAAPSGGHAQAAGRSPTAPNQPKAAQGSRPAPNQPKPAQGSKPAPPPRAPTGRQQDEEHGGPAARPAPAPPSAPEEHVTPKAAAPHAPPEEHAAPPEAAPHAAPEEHAAPPKAAPEAPHAAPAKPAPEHAPPPKPPAHEEPPH
jgi:hypothetical protein